jgi:hypothetical protein
MWPALKAAAELPDFGCLDTRGPGRLHRAGEAKLRQSRHLQIRYFKAAPLAPAVSRHETEQRALALEIRERLRVALSQQGVRLDLDHPLEHVGSK